MPENEVNWMTFFKVGDQVKADKFGPLENDFGGIVEKVYDNSIMIAIKDFAPADKTSVNELNGRAVIRKDEATMVKAVERTAEDEEAAAKEEKEKGAKASKSSKKKRPAKKSEK